MIRLFATVILLLLSARAFADDGCRLSLTPANLDLVRGGAAKVVTAIASPPGGAMLENADLTPQPPEGVRAEKVAIAAAGASDRGWTVNVSMGKAAPHAGQVIFGLQCTVISTVNGKPLRTVRLAAAALPLTAVSPTLALAKVKLTVVLPDQPINELHGGSIGLKIENQGDEDLTDASVSAAWPGYLLMSPKMYTIGAIGAGTTTTLSFDVTQKAGAKTVAGAAPPSLTLTARVAGESQAGSITVAAAPDINVFGLSDVLKLLQVPTFLLLPGVLFLATCQIIGRLRGQQTLPIIGSATDAPFWLVAVTLSGVAAALYPVVTGWFGPPREYLTSFTLEDVMLVWFASITLPIPLYLVGGTIVFLIKAELARRAAAETARTVPNENDPPLVFLRKLMEAGATPNGQVFQAYALVSGGATQTVLRARLGDADHDWVMPQASLQQGKDNAAKVDWNAIDAALAAAGDREGLAALFNILGSAGAAIDVSWQIGRIIDRPNLRARTELNQPTDRLAVIER